MVAVATFHWQQLQMAEEDGIAKGQQLARKAEKKLYCGCCAVLGSNYEEAAELFKKSATSFKLAKSCVFSPHILSHSFTLASSSYCYYLIHASSSSSSSLLWLWCWVAPRVLRNFEIPKRSLMSFGVLGTFFFLLEAREKSFYLFRA